jgi:hypothetical protein
MLRPPKPCHTLGIVVKISQTKFLCCTLGIVEKPWMSKDASSKLVSQYLIVIEISQTMGSCVALLVLLKSLGRVRMYQADFTMFKAMV